MAYIGKQPVVGNFVKLDAITTSATTTFNLLNGGTAYYPQTANNCIVSLNGVIQSPTTDYTISGSTIVFASALTTSDVINFITVFGDVLSIGTPSDGTITSAKLASGTTGLIAWQSVQTTGFTAVAGRGYPCNTTSAAFTVTLPASPSVGDQIAIVDYAGTFATNNITLARNGLKIEGSTSGKSLTTNREAVIITYVDATQGWVSTSASNYGTQSIDPAPYSVDFLVVAGGGGGGSANGAGQGGGGGGAGGYRSSNTTYGGSGGGGSAESSLTFKSGTVYTITIGGGGTGGTGGGSLGNEGTNGSDSQISGSGLTTITSTGGGGGCNADNSQTVNNGGSGGGAGSGGGTSSGGLGTANQGYNGGANDGAGGAYKAGGGGGAAAVGVNGASSSGNGGNGVSSTITGSSVTRAGGGGGGPHSLNNTQGTGGTGGGGASGISGSAGTSGTTNLGGGGGGGSAAANGGAGGSGVVILRMPTASYSSTTTGSPTVSTSGSDTILVYNASGTYTG